MTQKKIPTVKDILDRVNSLEIKRPPSLKYFLDMDQYFSEMKRALQVIDEYKAPDVEWNPVKMVQDALLLSAIHTTMAEMVGYLQGNSTRSEDSKKMAQAQYYNDIKTHRDELFDETGQFVKISEKEIENNARVLAKDFITNARDSESVSRIISSAWYAIGDFCRILQTAINRANREQNL